MAKRQKRTLEAILEIDLENGYYSYAQILDQDVVFFDICTQTKLVDIVVLNTKNVLFFLGVYDDAITKGRWKKVGDLPIRDEFLSVPNKFIHDQLSPGKFELYVTDTGDIRPSTKEECRGLECASVWEAEEVEERIRDHYAGRINRLVMEDQKLFE